MLYYCTLFDSNYISKGIALYLSLERHTDDFLLYVMAMDRKCEKMFAYSGGYPFSISGDIRSVPS